MAPNDFRKEWPKIKRQLVQVSREALDLAKKGERELIRFSRKGKLHFDATALSLKKEHLFLLIGKEYVKAGCPRTQTSQLKKFIEELKKIDKETRRLKKSLDAVESQKV